MREGETVHLTPKSFDILLALVESSGEVIEKEELMKRVWPDSFVEEGNVTYNVSVLRKALGERANEHQYIVTVPGRGYQFVANVSEVPLASTEFLSAVERRAEGHHSDSYVGGISTGSIRNVTVGTLKALARGFGVAETQVFAACGVSLPDSEFSDTEFAKLFSKYRYLSMEHKRQVDAFLEMLIREIDLLLLLSDLREEQGPPLPQNRETLCR